MTICGIIAEYNPFHLGHLYHYRQAKALSRADAVIVVMSGPFVQRGEPALADPHLRARWAVEAGADLVIELPPPYACHNAQLFARGAVGLLDAMGCVDSFAFGCETPRQPLLTQLAQLLYREPAALSDLIGAGLRQGLSFPRARQQAVTAYLGEETGALLSDANNNLALEYLQALLYLHSSLTPLFIARKGGSYRSARAGDDFSSATAIRAALEKKQSPPGLSPTVAQDLAREKLLFPDALTPLVRWYLTFTPPEQLGNLPDMGEGLHLRLRRAARQAGSYRELVDLALTKRYSEPRIKRALLHGLIGMTAGDTAMLRRNLPLYARPLAMGNRGGELLSLIAERGRLPLVTRLGRYKPRGADQQRLWALSRRAWDLYALLQGAPMGEDAARRLAVCPMAADSQPAHL